MISFDNLFQLKAENLGLDKEEGQKVSLVSHGHTDHLPTAYKNNYLACSDVTRKIIHFRKGIETLKYDSKKIEMRDAGHMIGSKMFLIDKKLLYTGDLNTQGDYCGKAEAVKCKTLIIECTYGLPKYVFPSRKEIVGRMKEYISENPAVLLMAQDATFGKPQEFCAILDKLKIPFSVNERIGKANDFLRLKFKHFDKDASVIVTDQFSEGKYEPIYKRMLMTGWALGKEKQGSRFGLELPFSSHCDYPSLVDFVKKCNPEKVYTHHGYAKEFSADLRKLGFDAQPLAEFTHRKVRKKREYQSTLF